MAGFGKESKAIRKVDSEYQTVGRAPRKLVFAHKCTANQTVINLNALSAPPEMTARGFLNPSAALIGEAHIKLYRNNLTLTSSSKGKLIDYLSYDIISPTQIQLVDFFDGNGNPGADDGEIIVGELEITPQRANLFVDALPLVKTGTLLAGQTDITLPFPVEINANPDAQVSDYLLFVDDKPMFRNVNNATASSSADGNYQEVPAVGGLTNLIRMNEAVNYDRNYIIHSAGFVERPEGSTMAAVEAALGAVNGMKATVAALAGVPESTFGTTPSTVDLSVFGNMVLDHEARLSPRSEVAVSTGNSHGSTTGVKIRRFSTVLKNSGLGISYIDDVGAGARFVINQPGIYAIHYTDRNDSSGYTIGISLNSTELSTNIWQINNADIIAYSEGQSGGYTTTCSVTLELKAGDIIRAHTDGLPNNAGRQSRFRIVKVAG